MLNKIALTCADSINVKFMIFAREIKYLNCCEYDFNFLVSWEINSNSSLKTNKLKYFQFQIEILITMYYRRKKAKCDALSFWEFVWILFNFIFTLLSS